MRIIRRGISEKSFDKYKKQTKQISGKSTPSETNTKCKDLRRTWDC
jgi:hypothetical protein